MSSIISDAWMKAEEIKKEKERQIKKMKEMKQASSKSKDRKQPPGEEL